MPYAIHIIFDPAKGDVRAARRDEHIAYIGSQIARVIAAGPLVGDDGIPFGGVTILDTDDLAEAEAFCAADPYVKSGLVVEHRLFRWSKTIYDRQDMTAA